MICLHYLIKKEKCFNAGSLCLEIDYTVFVKSKKRNNVLESVLAFFFVVASSQIFPQKVVQI